MLGIPDSTQRKIGAVAIPINAKLHGREAAWICSNGGASLAFVSDDTVGALNEVMASTLVKFGYLAEVYAPNKLPEPEPEPKSPGFVARLLGR